MTTSLILCLNFPKSPPPPSVDEGRLLLLTIALVLGVDVSAEINDAWGRGKREINTVNSCVTGLLFIGFSIYVTSYFPQKLLVLCFNKDKSSFDLRTTVNFY